MDKPLTNSPHLWPPNSNTRQDVFQDAIYAFHWIIRKQAVKHQRYTAGDLAAAIRNTHSTEHPKTRFFIQFLEENAESVFNIRNF